MDGQLSDALGSDSWLRKQHLHPSFLADVLPTRQSVPSNVFGSKEQRIDDDLFCTLTGGRPTISGHARRSRSLSPHREQATLEERMGPSARLRCRSLGWRPLCPRVRRQPPPNNAPIVPLVAADPRRSRSPLCPPPPRESTDSLSTPRSMPSAVSGSVSSSADLAHVQMQQGPWMWGGPMAAHAQQWTQERAPAPAPAPARRPVAQRATQDSTPQPVWAWRYGKGGEWHSVQGCTVAVERGCLIVRRGAALQQALPCASVLQAVTYGALGRLIVAGQPGTNSMFLSLEKVAHKNTLTALRRHNVPVNTVPYADFFGLQKQLTFPPAPLQEARDDDVCGPPPLAPGPERASANPAPKQSAPQPPKPPQPPPKPAPAALPVSPGMQKELMEQLNELRKQQEQLAAIEKRLATMQAGQSAAAAP
eukprot:TRINITY_DN4005_c2_g1_i1.p1 TRINITY_DN4005_c2_g1~~TRINITY_DN4005_c2_g1_i1.p1  ORF type:complete len:450 (+),score=131.07 TRINITY_DN4005_c2_g1_i1:88-1350(+)